MESVLRKDTSYMKSVAKETEEQIKQRIVASLQTLVVSLINLMLFKFI